MINMRLKIGITELSNSINRSEITVRKFFNYKELEYMNNKGKIRGGPTSTKKDGYRKQYTKRDDTIEPTIGAQSHIHQEISKAKSFF